MKVIELKWEGPGTWCGQPHWLACSPIGLYSVTDHSVHGNGVQWQAPNGESDGEPYDTDAKAKAAAQADFEARVLSSLRT